MTASIDVHVLADTLVLGSLLEMVRDEVGSYDLLAHWQQGEFHHDVLLRLPEPVHLSASSRPHDSAAGPSTQPAEYIVVAINCNGGVKEVLCFDREPERYALWHHRCPENPDFEGALPDVLARAVTVHWFDPCELLVPEARSELRERAP